MKRKRSANSFNPYINFSVSISYLRLLLQTFLYKQRNKNFFDYVCTHKNMKKIIRE